MIYAIEFTPQGQEDLLRLGRTIAQNISNKIVWLSLNIENIIPTSLVRKSVDNQPSDASTSSLSKLALM